MNASARLVRQFDEVDTIAIAIARALARQHHAVEQASRAARDNRNAHD